MVDTNRNGTIVLDLSDRTKMENMAAFDELPLDLRTLLCNAHFNINIKPGRAAHISRRTMHRVLLDIAVESAIATYGKNYPVETIK